MPGTLNFTLKVFLLSGTLSLLIKYLGPNLGVAPTSVNALIAVLSPTIILAALLSWRIRSSQQKTTL